MGQMANEGQIVVYLCERLKVEDWLRRHPEILEQEIRAPLFITGLPRTGTTALSHALAEDPETRSLLSWESQSPTPPPEAASYRTDPRIQQADERAALINTNPDFVKMYDGGPTKPTENIDLLGQHFRTQHFEGMANIPTYVRWWLGCDMVPAYEHHRRILKLLQWRCGPTRWNLKSPPDMCCLDAFAAVYPDARIIWTHRHPAKVLASVCKIVQIIRELMSDEVDLHELGRQQLELWSEGMRRMLDFRARVEAGAAGLTHIRFADVYMRDLLQRPIETVASVYDRFGLPLGSDAERRMRTWLNEHPQHRHGTVAYSLEDFGLDRDTVCAAFRDYTLRFDLRLED
jgi:hypothetical protein